jgi:hypothetical protein
MAKTKIWEVGGSFYTTEKGFKQAIEQYLKYNYSDGTTYRIFELSKTLTIADYKRQKEADERDKGIRSVLGELTKEEKLEIELKAKFENFIKVMDSLGINDSNYKFIKSNTHKPKALLKFIKDYKAKFLTLSNNVEYYKALLSIHGFKELSKKEGYWDYRTHKYEIKETIFLDKSYHDAFDMAKLELKKKK